MGTDASKIGTVGGAATVPGGYAVIPGQNVIIAEAFYYYTPLLGATNIVSAFTAQTLYKSAVYKPRQGMLTTLTTTP